MFVGKRGVTLKMVILRRNVHRQKLLRGVIKDESTALEKSQFLLYRVNEDKMCLRAIG